MGPLRSAMSRCRAETAGRSGPAGGLRVGQRDRGRPCGFDQETAAPRDETATALGDTAERSRAWLVPGIARPLETPQRPTRPGAEAAPRDLAASRPRHMARVIRCGG